MSIFAYEIAKKNVDETVKEKVLNGDIKSLKEFKQYIGQLDNGSRDNLDVKKEEQKASRENYLKNAVAEMIYANRDNSDSSNYILAEKILRFLKVSK